MLNCPRGQVPLSRFNLFETTQLLLEFKTSEDKKHNNEWGGVKMYEEKTAKKVLYSLFSINSVSCLFLLSFILLLK